MVEVANLVAKSYSVWHRGNFDAKESEREETPGRVCREVELDSVKNPHLDHGYAVTSHSSQGQTADRVLIHADTELE